MVSIQLRLDYCKKCGDCCLNICKDKYFNGDTCINPNKMEGCLSFPIVKVGGEFLIYQCKGVLLKKIPVERLEGIIAAINQGKEIESSEKGLYISVKQS